MDFNNLMGVHHYDFLIRQILVNSFLYELLVSYLDDEAYMD